MTRTLNPILVILLSLALLVGGSSLLGTLVAVPLGFGEEPDFRGLLLLAGLFVGLAGTIYPLCVALTNDYLESRQMVSASATLLLIFGLGTIAGSVGGALVMDVLERQGHVWVGAVRPI